MDTAIVRLPFRQKEIQGGQDPPLNESAEVASPAIAELYRHRPNYISRLLESASLNLLDYNRGVLCISLMVSEEDRAWLKSHEREAEHIFRRVKRVQLADSERFWDISPETRVYFGFPEEHKTRMRVGFFVKNGGEDPFEWKGGADFLLDTH